MKHIKDLLPETIEEIKKRKRLIERYEIKYPYGRLCGDCGKPLDDITTNACPLCARLNKYEGSYDHDID